MATAYTKEFLVEIVLWKYKEVLPTQQELGRRKDLLNAHFDKVGKVEFRKNCSITPELVRLYNDARKSGLEFLEVSCYNGDYE